MTKKLRSNVDRSVRTGRDISGSIVITGDHSSASLERVSLPRAENVDIATEVKALRGLLGQLDTPHLRKVANAVEEADDEVQQPSPDRNEVGKAIERAIGYAKTAAGFASVVEKLKPHLVSIVAWLGKDWHSLLSAIGLTT